jgi:hypothetical protein
MVQHGNVQITDRQRTPEWYEKVLGARARDRGTERNARQLQVHTGNAKLISRGARTALQQVLPLPHPQRVSLGLPT